MSNSPLATIKNLSPYRDAPRTHKIDTITIHTMAGNMSAESCAYMFASTDPNVNPYKASANYAIGSDGKIALCVDEANRSYCSSNTANDQRAVTIEVASLVNYKEPYNCSPEALESLIALCADICRRNKIDALRWRADKSLIGQPDKQNMTVHRWFAQKSCPGEYLYGKMGEIAAAVNKRLGAPVTPVPSKPAAPDKPATITVGSNVMITGDQYSTGQVVPLWARNVPHAVSRIDGGKALLGNPDGINSWVAIKDLKRV